jgi:hypothetical protein
VEGASAGIYFDDNGTEHGFVRSSHGEITTIDPPGSVGTMVCEETCLSAEGKITGSYYDATSIAHGFVRDPGGRVWTFDAPGAGTGAGQGTIAASINLEGAITGYFADKNSALHGFVRSREGHFTEFDVPSTSSTTVEGTGAFSINFRVRSPESSSTRRAQCMVFPGCPVALSPPSMLRAQAGLLGRGRALRPTTRRVQSPVGLSTLKT